MAINLFRQCRKIIGIGRNYPDGKTPPSEPVVFLKSPSSMIAEGTPIVLPKRCTEVIHEIELGVVIGKGGANIPVAEALNHVHGYTMALDMTAMCELKAVREAGYPWSVAKNYDTFCPVSEIIDRKEIPDPDNVALWLKLNGEMKQDDNTKKMIIGIPHLINFCSQIMSLNEGDMIITGSPMGISPVKSGDVIECGFKGIKEMKFLVQ